MSTALREIIASFGTEFDGKALEKGDSAVNGMIGTLKKFLPAVAEAFAVKEIGEFAFGLAEQAEQLELNARAIGISTDALQKWDYAANLSGVGAEAMNTGLEKLERSAVKAGKGGSLAFGSIKVSVDKAGGGFKDADELLGDVSEAIAGMQDPTEQVGAAMAAFGRSGAKLLPFLKQGRAGIAELKAEVDDLGGGFTESFIDKSSEMIRDSKRLDFALLGLKVNAVGPLIDYMAEAADAASKVVVTFSNWTKKSNATQAALLALGIGGTAALLPLIVSIAPIVLGFLALEDAVTFLSGGKSEIGKLIDNVFGVGAQQTVQAFFKGISDDTKLASDNAYAFQVKWQTAIGAIRDEKTKTFNDSFWAPWLDAYYATVKAMSGGWGGFASYVVALAQGLVLQLRLCFDDIEEAGGLAIAWIEDQFDQLPKHIGEALSHIPGLKDIGAEIVAQDANERGPDEKAGFNVENQKTANRAREAERLKQAEAVAARLGLGDVNLDARNVASAPVIGPPIAPTMVTNSMVTHITQNIKADTPEDIKKAASDGAKAGVVAGTNDRTKRALVPVAG